MLAATIVWIFYTKNSQTTNTETYWDSYETQSNQYDKTIHIEEIKSNWWDINVKQENIVTPKYSEKEEENIEKSRLAKQFLIDYYNLNNNWQTRKAYKMLGQGLINDLIDRDLHKHFHPEKVKRFYNWIDDSIEFMNIDENETFSDNETDERIKRIFDYRITYNIN